MEFNIKSGSPEKQRSACVAVGIFEGRKMSLPAELIDKASDGLVSSVMRSGDMEGKAGTTLLMRNVPGVVAERVLLVGMGKEREYREKDYIATVRAAVKAMSDTGAPDGAMFLAEAATRVQSVAWRIRQGVITAQETVYAFDRYKTQKKSAKRPFRKLTLVVGRRTDLPEAETALAEGIAIADGIERAREFANLPGNVCSPSWFAEEAEKLAEELGLECQVLEEADLEKERMGALLAVAQGSHEPPRLVVLKWNGGREGSKPIALVGKGITFDSGGISLKPPADMDEMKFDMSGAAATLGAITAAAAMKLPLNLVAVIPLAENMPGGGAARPGDIVCSRSGQTIEILNTDAEGRLILCDALDYAGIFSPELVIDMATLTGACVVALGKVASGLFTNDDALARELFSAGEIAQDRLWRLPLWDEYQPLIDSTVADIANTGGRQAGSVTAACFLSRFTEKYRWAHLDIAGTAYLSGKEKGATGRPVSLLMHFLLKRAGQL
ncbi:MAG: leucyl aminopeptidase [Zoogloeaceae bacterium]|jgi:leucyl aminopeptidase|nr:leucyl aminopeptidase [Zoogloeaceae bacterium]